MSLHYMTIQTQLRDTLTSILNVTSHSTNTTSCDTPMASCRTQMTSFDIRATRYKNTSLSATIWSAIQSQCVPRRHSHDVICMT